MPAHGASALSPGSRRSLAWQRVVKVLLWTSILGGPLVTIICFLSMDTTGLKGLGPLIIGVITFQVCFWLCVAALLIQALQWRWTKWLTLTAVIFQLALAALLVWANAA